GSPQVRSAAAEARLALLQLASKRLGTPVDRLTGSKGIVSVIGDANRSLKYGELTGDKPFNLPVTGSAPVKPAGQYKIAGKSVPRNDIPDKVSGKHVYMQHVR